MKLSIIVPVYNAEPFLKRCLDSIRLRQNVELVLVDNGCTDNSREIMASFPGPKKIVVCLKNIGVSGARNEGMKKATGDYITFIDADDEYTPEGVETMLTAIKANPNADVFQFNHLRAFPNGGIMQKFYNPPRVYDAMNLPKLWPVVWNKVYSRKAIDGITFDEELAHGEDELYNLQIFERVKRIHGQEFQTVIHHKDNPKSLTRQLTREDLKNEQAALISFLEKCEDMTLRRSVCVRLSELWTNPTYLGLFGGTP